MMKIYILFIVMISICFADIPFRIKQQKVKVAGEAISIGIQGKTDNLKLTVYRIKNPALFLSKQNNFRKLQIENTEIRMQLNYAIENSNLAKKPQIYGKVSQNKYFSLVAHLDTIKVESGQDGYKKITIRNIREEGIYIVECRLKNYISYVLAANTNLAIITRRDNNQLLAYAVNRKTGRPYPNTTISLYRNGKLLVAKQGNHKGIAHFDMSYYPKLLVVASNASHFTADNPMFFPSIVNTSKCYIFTDRPMYLPGEKVHFKGIIREQISGVYSVPNATNNVDYHLNDARGNKIASGKVILSNGSFSGKIALGKKVALGTFILSCTVIGKKFQTEFQVEKFEKPKFIVSVSSKSKAILMGKKAHFIVTSSYYSGGEITSAKVQYTLYKSAFHQPLFQVTGLDQFYSKNEFRSFKPVLVKTGNASLKKGTLTLSFDTSKDKMSYNYRLKVTVRDESRNIAGGSGSIKVEPYPVKLDIQTSKDLYALEEQIIVKVKSVDINNKPIKASFFLVATRKERLNLGNTKTAKNSKKFFTLQGTTNNKGELSVEIPAALTGAIDIELRAKNNGAKITKTVWVSAGKAPLLYSGNSILIVPDKKTYRVGEMATILVVLPTSRISPLITLEGVTLIQYNVTSLTANSYVLKLPITKQMSPNVYIRVSTVYKNGFIESEQMIVVPPRQKILNIDIASKKSYLPGEKATLQISVKDHQGKPVSTDLSLAVIDKSIYSLASDQNAPLHSFFYSLRRQNVGSNSSIDLLSYDYARISNRLPKPKILKQMYNMKKKMSMTSGGAYEEADHAIEEAGDEWGNASEGESDDIDDWRADSEADPVQTATASNPQRNSPRPVAREAKKKPAKQKNVVKQNARKLFKTTAAWFASVHTNKNGKAEVSFIFPDNLSDWKIISRAIDSNTRIGQVTRTTATRKPVMVTLTHPSFLVVGDTVDASIQARNGTIKSHDLSIGLDASSHFSFEKIENTSQKIKAGKWLRKQVVIKAQNAGNGNLQTIVSGDLYDSEIKKCLVIPHGIVKNFGYAGQLTEKIKHHFSMPENVAISQSKITVRVLPGFVAAIRESLNMLLEYPYGCAEQTMSRFMPNLVASEVLQKLNEKVDITVLNKNVTAGILRLSQLQNKDGGWGWWQRGEASHPMLSAYVTLGLVRAEKLNHTTGKESMKRALLFLKAMAKNKTLSYHEKAYIAYALALAKALPSNFLDTVFDREQRLEADSYTLSLLALAYVAENRNAEAKVLAKQLAKKAQLSGDGFLFWGSNKEFSWNKNAVEVTAMVARAFIAINDQYPLINPALEWLMKQRKDRGWNATKDTAEVILTLCRYLQTSESKTNESTNVAIVVNGEKRNIEVDKESITVVFNNLKESSNELQIHTSVATKHLYYSAHIEYFTQEKNIAPSSNNIAVERNYFVLRADGEKFNKEKLGNNILPDDIVMVELEITCDKTYEFVMLEDHIPASAKFIRKDRDYSVAGVEKNKFTHREFHTIKSVHFFTELTQGKHKIHYFFRASVAGKFHALPAIVSLMYYPAIRGNSSEQIFTFE